MDIDGETMDLMLLKGRGASKLYGPWTPFAMPPNHFEAIQRTVIFLCLFQSDISQFNK